MIYKLTNLELLNTSTPSVLDTMYFVDKQIVNYNLWAKSSLQLFFFLNKVLLEHHLFVNCLWLLSHYKGRDEELCQMLYHMA